MPELNQTGFSWTPCAWPADAVATGPGTASSITRPVQCSTSSAHAGNAGLQQGCSKAQRLSQSLTCEGVSCSPVFLGCFTVPSSFSSQGRAAAVLEKSCRQKQAEAQS